jgi:hypothetical protein
LDSAVAILQQVEENDQEQQGKDSLHCQLKRLLARVDLDASMYLGIRPPGLTPQHGLDDNCIQHTSPDDLEGVLDAANGLLLRATFFKRMVADNYRYRDGGDVPLDTFEQRNRLLCEYRQMDEQLGTIAELWRHSEPRSKILVCQIQVKMGLTMAYGCLHKEESLYDSLMETFEEIIQLCEKALGDTTEGSFTLERGLIHPLYWTVSKCRDCGLRRRALELLRRCPREGVWIAEIHARIARRVIEIEEGVETLESSSDEILLGCAGIPEFRRIHSVDLTFDKTARLIYMTYQTCPNGLEGGWDVSLDVLQY